MTVYRYPSHHREIRGNGIATGRGNEVAQTGPLVRYPLAPQKIAPMETLDPLGRIVHLVKPWPKFFSVLVIAL